MRFFRVDCALGPEALRDALGELDAVAVRIGAAGSEEEFLLAAHLAERSFAEKKNIAKRPAYEFMLWLAATKDIKSAIKTFSPKEGERGFFIAVFSDAPEQKIMAQLKAEKLPLGLERRGEALALERISLSRV